jgi:hypothetical protein
VAARKRRDRSVAARAQRGLAPSDQIARAIRFASHKRSTHSGTLEEATPRRALGRDRVRCRQFVGWVERKRNPSPRRHRARELDGFRAKRSTHPTKPSYSPCQTAQFLRSRLVAASGFFSFFFTFVAADPRSRGLAERREASALIRVAQVTRDATLARHGTSRATRRPASRRSALALSAQVPPPSPLPGPARRLHATRHFCLAAVPGFSCPQLPAAVDATSRSAFRIVSGRRPS